MSSEVAPISLHLAPTFGEVAPDSGDFALTLRHVAPSPRNIAPSSPEVAPTLRRVASSRPEVVPTSPDVAPTSSHVAPKEPDVAPQSPDLAPMSSHVAPMSRDVAPPRRYVGSGARQGESPAGCLQAAHVTAKDSPPVLEREVGELEGLVRAKRRRHLPVVLTREEVRAILLHLKGVNHLFTALLYGTGLRLAEAQRLRVKDLDFARHQITVRDGKGAKDRITMLPASLEDALRSHLKDIKRQHAQDLKNGNGKVYLPYALERKYPSAASEWGWQYVFPGPVLSKDPRSGVMRRHYLNERPLQRLFRAAVRVAGVAKHATLHTAARQRLGR